MALRHDAYRTRRMQGRTNGNMAAPQNASHRTHDNGNAGQRNDNDGTDGIVGGGIPEQEAPETEKDH
jgi:hypothetical protein